MHALTVNTARSYLFIYLMQSIINIKDLWTFVLLHCDIHLISDTHGLQRVRNVYLTLNHVLFFCNSSTLYYALVTPIHCLYPKVGRSANKFCRSQIRKFADLKNLSDLLTFRKWDTLRIRDLRTQSFFLICGALYFYSTVPLFEPSCSIQESRLKCSSCLNTILCPIQRFVSVAGFYPSVSFS
jgi:hypothetical protein